jgi:hypothetical protein
MLLRTQVTIAVMSTIALSNAQLPGDPPPPQAPYAPLGSYVWNGGNLWLESSVARSTAAGTHRFVGSFFIHQKVWGSSEPAPWTSPFTPLSSSPHGYDYEYDLEGTFTAPNQDAWVRLIVETEGGYEVWKKTADNSQHKRDRNWYYVTSPAYVVGPF